MFPTLIEAATTLLTFAGLAYLLLALWSARAFLLRRLPAASGFAPPISILKPVRGLDPEMYEAFASHCRQDYPGEYEILFGASSLDDPAIPAIERLQSEFPDHSIRLILCPESLGPNGKVSNLAQMLPHARFDHLIVNDSDIRVGTWYLAHIAYAFDSPDTPSSPVGLVTAPYRGRSHGTLGSRMEALGISTDFMPGVFTARFLDRGVRFGLGSTLAFTRAALNAIGGLLPLTTSLADDYELGRRISQAGYTIRLTSEVVETSVPAYPFGQFWAHQLRWARGVRDSRRAGYAGLALSYGLAWASLNLIASGCSLFSIALFSLTFLARFTVAIGIGAGMLGDRQVLRDLWLLLPRDLIALAVWTWSYAGDTVTWRGETFKLKDGILRRAE